VDIRSYIYGLADIFPGPLKTAARWVADRAFAVWDDVSTVFRATVPRWREWFNAATGFANNLVSAVAEAANTVRWIVLQWVPNFVRSKVDDVRNWASAVFNDVRNWAAGIVSDVRNWAAARLNDLLDFATRVRDWALERIQEVWRTLTTVADIVGRLLTDPAQLAQWVAGAMFWALLRVADALIEPLAEWFWARRQALILKTLSRLESIIARLL
jgi:hypothetical protein